jgi:hypothetical protein
VVTRQNPDAYAASTQDRDGVSGIGAKPVPDAGDTLHHPVQRDEDRAEAVGDEPDSGRCDVRGNDGTSGLDALLDEGFRVEGAGWKGQTGTVIIASSTTRRFYTQVARWAAERGWLRLCFLRLDGHPVAFDYNVHAGRVYYGLKGGYDEAFRRFAGEGPAHGDDRAHLRRGRRPL